MALRHPHQPSILRSAVQDRLEAGGGAVVISSDDDDADMAGPSRPRTKSASRESSPSGRNTTSSSVPEDEEMDGGSESGSEDEDDFGVDEGQALKGQELERIMAVATENGRTSYLCKFKGAHVPRSSHWRLLGCTRGTNRAQDTAKMSPSACTLPLATQPVQSTARSNT